MSPEPDVKIPFPARYVAPGRSTSALDLLTPSDDDRHVPEPPAVEPGKVRGAGPLNPGRLR